MGLPAGYQFFFLYIDREGQTRSRARRRDFTEEEGTETSRVVETA